MSEAVLIALVSAVVNAVALWATMQTKLQWLRTDVDDLEDRVGLLEKRRA